MVLSLALHVANGWSNLYLSGWNGNGPPNITFELSSRRDGMDGYRISVFEINQGSPAVRLSLEAFPVKFVPAG